MKLFAFLLRSSQAIVLTAVLIGAIGGAATIGQLALIRSALHVDPATGAISRSQLALAFAAMCVLVLATRLVSDRLLAKLSQRSVSRILRHLCGRIVESPLRRIEEVGQARLLVTLTEDISMITMALNGVPVVAVNLITLVLGLAYLGWISPPLFLPLTGVLVFGVGSYMAASRGARHFLKQGREQSDVLMRHVRTVVNGVKELKLHDARREAFFSDVLFPADEEVRRLQLKGFSIQAAAINWGRLLFLITIGLVLFAWPLFVAIDPASQAAVVLTVLFLMAPVERVMAYLPLFSRANIGLRKVQELGLSLEGDEPTQGEPITSWNRLELDDVSFAYVDQATDREFRLGPLSLELTPGEIVFVVGGNGGGKTTLIKLLSGLYAADSGELRLDGRPLAPADLPAYRQLFSVVFDEPVLFEQLVGLDKPGWEEQARRYLRELELEDRVTIANGTLSTVDLSKGQRKRLALLTAYLEDRPIYIFDEWAADQDPVFKRVFYREILVDLRRRGKTVVAISHDDQYFDAADRIVRLSEGRLLPADEMLAAREC